MNAPSPLLAWASGELWAMEPVALEAMMASLASAPQAGSDAFGDFGSKKLRPTYLADGTAVISIGGILTYNQPMFRMFLGGSDLGQITDAVNEAAGNAQVPRILLAIDSPGGMITGLPEAAAAVRRARLKKPVLAVADSSAYSAAYWIAASASKLYVLGSGGVGSIGVFSTLTSYEKALKKLGIDMVVIRSTPEKAEGHPALKISPEAKAAAQREVDLVYRQFLRAVAEGRGTSIATVETKFGRGRAVNAKDALRRGMVDKIGGVEAALAANPILARARASATRAPYKKAVSPRSRKLRLLELGGRPDHA